jgi:FkbM family methyltransferase
MSRLDISKCIDLAGLRPCSSNAGVILIDRGAKRPPKLLGLRDKEYKGRLQITIKARALPGATKLLVVNDGGTYDVAFLRTDGHAVATLRAEDTSSSRIDEGYYEFRVVWANSTPSIYIGLASSYRTTYTSSYAVTSDVEQWLIVDVMVEHLPVLAPDAAALTLVDVGALGGLGNKFDAIAERLIPVMFEPIPEEASKAQEKIREKYPKAIVVPYALGNRDGKALLHITKAPSCSSIRKPNTSVVSRYPIAAKFDILRTIEVTISRYDTLFTQGMVPQPDVLKIDVQGYEYEVLLGFGDLLRQVVGIEIEAHNAPVYEGQKLLSEIATMLDHLGFGIMAIRPNHPIGWNRD